MTTEQQWCVVRCAVRFTDDDVSTIEDVVGPFATKADADAFGKLLYDAGHEYDIRPILPTESVSLAMLAMPCPFCDSQPSAVTRSDNTGAFVVCCDNEDCAVRPSAVAEYGVNAAENKRLAIAAWNRRGAE